MVKEATQPVIQKIDITQLSRQKEDIQTYLEAVDTAQNIRYPKRTELYRIYKNVLMDGHLSSVVSKRIRAVKNSGILFMQDGKDTSDMMEWIRGPWFTKLLKLCMESKFWGHSLIEPVLVNGKIEDVKLIPRHHVCPEKGLIYLRAGGFGSSIPYRQPPYGNMLLEVGEEDDLGLLMQATPYVLYKRGAVADWAQFCELFGMPIRKYTYNPIDPGARALAKEAAEAAGSASYIIIPNGVDLQLEKGTDSASSGVYNEFRQAMNEEMSITVLGQNLTTSNSDTGSFSLGQVHLTVEQAINFEDKLEMEYVLNWKFKDMLLLFGYPVKNGIFKFDDTEKLPIEKQLELDIKLAERVPMADEYFYEKYGIPKPGKGAVITVLPGNKLKVTAPENEEEEENQKDEPEEKPEKGKKPEATAALKITGCCGDEITAELPEILNAVPELTPEEEALAKAIYDKDGVKFDRKTWEKNRNAFAKALKAGFPKVSTGYDDEDNIARAMMEANLNRFGFDKNLAQIYQLNQALKKPEVRTYNDFKKEAKSILGKINNTQLRTEYNFAVAASQSAANHIRAVKDKMKFGKYQTIGDSQVRAEHQALDGMVFPLEDKAAVKFTAPNGYNCRCEIIYLDDYDGKVSSGPDMASKIGTDELDRMKKGGFDRNYADMKEVFSQSQFYTEKILQENDPDFKLTDLTALNYDLNGIEKYADLVKKELPKLVLGEEKSKEDLLEWFKTKADKNKNISFTDVRGHSMYLKKTNFANHLKSEKYIAEQRGQLAEFIDATVSAADEIYLYSYENGKYSYRYLKFYDGKVMSVIAEIDEQYGMRIKTWYNAAEKYNAGNMVPVDVDAEIRKGLLVYNK